MTQITLEQAKERTTKRPQKSEVIVVDLPEKEEGTKSHLKIKEREGHNQNSDEVDDKELQKGKDKANENDKYDGC